MHNNETKSTGKTETLSPSEFFPRSIVIKIVFVIFKWKSAPSSGFTFSWCISLLLLGKKNEELAIYSYNF